MSERICSIDDCEKPHVARGWCEMHWRRWRKHGDPTVVVLVSSPPPRRAPRGACSIAGCDKPHAARGWCVMHYRRWEKHGDPTVVLQGSLPRQQPRELSPSWKGDDITYDSAHVRVRKSKGRAADQSCQHCGGQARHWAYDHQSSDEKLSNRGPYSPDPDHYFALCVPCHKRFDKSRRAPSWVST